MDRQLVKSLIDALAASDLSELEYSAGGETLRLVKGAPGRAGPAPAVPPAAGAAQPAPPAAPGGTGDGAVSAPAYGIVHLQRSPGAAPLVAAGDAVAAGQVLCLLESMKVFTELRSERAGTVTAVLVETGQEVEAGQPLFRFGP